LFYAIIHFLILFYAIIHFLPMQMGVIFSFLLNQRIDWLIGLLNDRIK